MVCFKKRNAIAFLLVAGMGFVICSSAQAQCQNGTCSKIVQPTVVSSVVSTAPVATTQTPVATKAAPVASTPVTIVNGCGNTCWSSTPVTTTVYNNCCGYSSVVYPNSSYYSVPASYSPASTCSGGTCSGR